MRILYEPELSMRSYEDGSWLLSSDSQLNKMIQCMKGFPDDWTWGVMLPMANQTRITTPLDLPLSRWIFEVPWAQNVQTNRFSFPMPDAQAALVTFRPDLILTETVEHAQNWRRALQHLNMTDVKIASITVLYDDWRDNAFMLRQIDGVLSSDVSFFSLPAIRDAWVDRALKITNVGGGKVIEVWDALFDPQEVIDRLAVMQTPPHPKPVINFISRLSNESLYHSASFFKAVRLMEAKGLDFEVWVADPNHARDEIWGESKKITRWRYASREEYLDSLIKSRVVPILYDQSTIHSLGYCEAVYARNIIVTPKPASQAVPTPGIFANPIVPEELAYVLERALTDETYVGVSWDDYLTSQIDQIESGRGIRTNLPRIQKILEELVVKFPS